jgi:hypothetical protein
MKGPNDLGPEFEGNAEPPQPPTVEAMCKTKWSAQMRSTVAQQAAVTTCGLEGRLLRRKV